MEGQYDLAYERKDNVLTLCEIKWSEEPIDTSIITEFETKISRSQFPPHLNFKRFNIESIWAWSKWRRG